MRIRTRFIAGIFLLMAFQAGAQKKKKEFAKDARELELIRDWYKKLPVSMNIRLEQWTIPAEFGRDSVVTDMDLAYGPDEFYMKSGDIEQLINDSLQVVINNEARIIRIFPSNLSYTAKISSFFGQGPFADSMYKEMKSRYDIIRRQDSAGLRELKLVSKTRVPGTALHREIISIFYRPENHQPVRSEQVKQVLLPLDETEYKRFSGELTCKDRLIMLPGDPVARYFLVKEERTDYWVRAIKRLDTDIPVRLGDRVIWNADGSCSAVARYADYLISVEN
ncbi:MAG: hypothetical protein HYZ15_06520 [Sphingobacteriales bacterium]|nr:hypothetical protein [Sphingobacteriales bacterium]